MSPRTVLAFDQIAFRILYGRKGFKNINAVARAAGLSTTAMHSIYWNKSVKPETQERLAKALDVTPDVLWRTATFTPANV